MLTPVHNLVTSSLKSLGKLHLPYTHKQTNSAWFHEFMALFRPGYWIASKTYGELSNPLIPGAMKHGALCVMHYGHPAVVEAIGKGVVVSDILDFFFKKDEIELYSPRFATDEDLDGIARYAKSLIGRPYDYSFASGNRAFYCFELLQYTYGNYRVRSRYEITMSIRFGRLTVAYADMIGSGLFDRVGSWRNI